MAEKYCGSYNRISAEKYDEFLNELGVNFLLRKAATASSPVFEVISKNWSDFRVFWYAHFGFDFQVTYDEASETWNFKTSTMLKSMELKFKLGEEFDEKSPDGRDVRAIVTKEGDSFVSTQTAKKDGEKSTKVVREFKGDEVIQTSTIVGSDLVCIQVFKRQ